MRQAVLTWDRQRIPAGPGDRPAGRRSGPGAPPGVGGGAKVQLSFMTRTNLLPVTAGARGCKQLQRKLALAKVARMADAGRHSVARSAGSGRMTLMRFPLEGIPSAPRGEPPDRGKNGS
jgi:hypothetical protein